jgi:hypothetical protein
LGTEKIHFDDREQAREALKIRLSKVWKSKMVLGLVKMLF